MEFFETTEIDPRAVRRLANSRGCPVTKRGSDYVVSGVALTDDEAWSVLSVMPVNR